MAYDGPMSSVKTVLVSMMVGAILGTVVASLVVPPLLSWYNEAGALTDGKQIQTLCNLPELIRYTSTRLIRGQLIGAGAGALLFLFPGLMSVRRRQAAVPATPPATT